MFYTHDEVVNELIGVVGTSRRDKYEEDLEMFLIGEAIKRTRLEKNLIVKKRGEIFFDFPSSTD